MDYYNLQYDLLRSIYSSGVWTSSKCALSLGLWGAVYGFPFSVSMSILIVIAVEQI